MKTNHTILVPPNIPEYREFYVSFYCLFRAIWNAKLQILRIKEAMRKKDIKKLFADIHFFLVAISNIQKMMQRMRKLLRRDKDFAIIFKKYLRLLKHLDYFRDHLEHFDERLDGVGKHKKPLTQPNMLGNLIGSEYDFGGERFKLNEAFFLVGKLQKDLLDWNKKNYKFPIA